MITARLRRRTISYNASSDNQTKTIGVRGRPMMSKKSTTLVRPEPRNNKKQRKQYDIDVSCSVGINNTLTLLDLNDDLLCIIFGKHLAPCCARVHLWYINKKLAKLLTYVSNVFKDEDVRILHKVLSDTSHKHYPIDHYIERADDEDTGSNLYEHQQRLMEDKVNDASIFEAKYVIQYSEYVEEELESRDGNNDTTKLIKWYDNYYKRPNINEPSISSALAPHVIYTHNTIFQFEMDRAVGILIRSVKTLDVEILECFSNSIATFFMPTLLCSSGLTCAHNVLLPEIRAITDELFNSDDLKTETSLWLHFVETIKHGDHYNIDYYEQPSTQNEYSFNGDSTIASRDYHRKFIAWTENIIHSIFNRSDPATRFFQHPKIRLDLFKFGVCFLGDLCNVFAAKGRLDALADILDSNDFMRTIPVDQPERDLYIYILIGAISGNNVKVLRWLSNRSRCKFPNSKEFRPNLFHKPVSMVVSFISMVVSFNPRTGGRSGTADSRLAVALRNVAERDAVDVLEWMWNCGCTSNGNDSLKYVSTNNCDDNECWCFIRGHWVCFCLLLVHCQFRRQNLSKFLSERPGIVKTALTSRFGYRNRFFYLIVLALRHNKTNETADWSWFWREVDANWPEEWPHYSTVSSETVDRTIVLEILDQKSVDPTGAVKDLDFLCNGGLFAVDREDVFDIVFSTLLGEPTNLRFNCNCGEPIIIDQPYEFCGAERYITSTVEQSRILVLQYCFRMTKRKLKDIITPFRLYNLGDGQSKKFICFVEIIFKAGKGLEWLEDVAPYIV